MTIITVDPESGDTSESCEWRYDGEVVNDSLEDESLRVDQTILYKGTPVNENRSFGEFDLTELFIRVVGVEKNQQELLSAVYDAVNSNYVSIPVNIQNHSKGTERKFTSWRMKDQNILDWTGDWYSDTGENEVIGECETSSGRPVGEKVNCKDLAEYFDNHPEEILLVHKNMQS